MKFLLYFRSSSSTPGQCRTNSDCNKWSPYCSDFGFCQWTDKFGDHPHEDDTNLVVETTYAETEYPDVFDVVTSASAYHEDSDADYDYKTYYQYYENTLDFDNHKNKSDSTTPIATNNPVSSTTEQREQTNIWLVSAIGPFFKPRKSKSEGQ